MEGKGKWFIAPIILVVIIIAINIAYYNKKRYKVLEGDFSEEGNKKAQIETAFDMIKPFEKKNVEKINRPFAIQIASFREKNKALLLVDKLKKEGYYSAYLASKNLKEKGIWHRVRIGGFLNKEKATSVLNSLKDKYPNSFIVYQQ